MSLSQHDPALSWLLMSGDPSIRSFTLTEVLDQLQEPLDMLEAKRQPDGWYWRSPGTRGSQVEVVDWGRRGPNAMLTLNALRVLKAASQLTTEERAVMAQ